ncbi:hypothetical protein [uncultured Bradyrhizobium sp.]|uniref:hypothetical protein n=1 Tax=uncultured Bradyrhizobium sp. TaxID=199684 RepID=UPI002634C13D|nr:hypothetical protein [uncultured Bradyrhizobium sp.]
MFLGAHPGDVDQVAVGDAVAFPQDRSCDIGVVVVGEATRQLPRNQTQVGKRAAQRGERPQLDALGQADQDVVEQPDMMLVEAVSVFEKQPRHLPQHARAAVRRACFQDIVEFGNKIGQSNSGHCGT